jgi:hypothetical protein
MLTNHLRHLLKHGTSAIPQTDLNAIADLRFTCAVFAWQDGDKWLLKLTSSKGAAERVRKFIREQGPVKIRKQKVKIYKP